MAAAFSSSQLGPEARLEVAAMKGDCWTILWQKRIANFAGVNIES